ncbi:MAG: type I secretion C-terminal target domain-containing protein, partial [Methylococcaceae bacterium]
KVIEKAGEGTDTVNSSITYTLETNVENLTLTGAATLNGTGNALNNTLTGNAAANILNGLAGNDTIVGLAGNDFLSGGLGTDKLTGGTGSDIFDFNTSTESAKGLARDTITDFTHSQGDKIDLAGIDANIKVLGNQGFTYIGAKAFTGVAGQLDYFNGILAGDTNGDKVADFEIALIGSPSLVSADFVL